uniref:Uncharacterized protein n=1 Tax=Proboscia inermis TaxID=420281 RepID=A0A7S0GJ75_9STRA|mmetsp:Transcript_4075/g.4201  ORF Transcript_4075/g.4201 Transcript_4075/m.4201 type:complete len:106 (+) Transcript_4075:408-725(+)
MIQTEHESEKTTADTNSITLTCRSDFEVLYTTLGYSITCPRIASVCIEMVCPSNCSGRGICDYTEDRPECICDDFMDESEGCWGDSREVRPKRDDAPLIYHPTLK